MITATQIVKTKTQAAKDLGVNERTLAKWVDEAWFPQDAVDRDQLGRKSNWNVPAIRAALNAWGKAGSDETRSAVQVRREREEERLKRETLGVALDELKLHEAQGELLPRRAMELFASTLLAHLADWCDQLPEVALPQLKLPKRYHDRVREIFRKEINARRVELREDLERQAREYKGGSVK